MKKQPLEPPIQWPPSICTANVQNIVPDHQLKAAAAYMDRNGVDYADNQFKPDPDSNPLLMRAPTTLPFREANS